MKTLQRYLFRFGTVSAVAYFPVVETVTHFANSHGGAWTCGCATWLLVASTWLLIFAGLALVATGVLFDGVAWIGTQLVAIDRSMR